MSRASWSVAHVIQPSLDAVHSSYLDGRRIRGTALRSVVGYRLIERNRSTSSRNIIGANCFPSLRRRRYNDNARGTTGWPGRSSNALNMADTRMSDGVTVGFARGWRDASASIPLVVNL